jgi:hypothetical protein
MLEKGRSGRAYLELLRRLVVTGLVQNTRGRIGEKKELGGVECQDSEGGSYILRGSGGGDGNTAHQGAIP